MKKIIPNILLLIVLIGCSDFLEPEMKGSTELKQLVSNQQGMLTIVNGMYQPMQGPYKGTMQRLTDLASDDGWTWRNELETDLFIVEAEFTYTASVWQQHYLGIGRTNVVLDNLNNVTDYTSAKQKEYFEGQALFMRAFYYFNLVRLFGGVPIILHQIGSVEDAQQPRASIQEVYDQIIKDLTNAEGLLPTEYTGATGVEKGRPTTYSASALKSLVYLEIANWDGVIESSSKIIGKGSLINYANNFNGTSENGTQSLFEVQYGGVTAELTTSLSSFYAPTTYSGSALILPTDDSFNGEGGGPSSGGSFVQEFENGDTRKDVIMATYGLPNFIDVSKPAGSLYYVNKYYNTTNPVGRSVWNFPLIRYAEILLIRAEALNEKAYAADGEAFSLLNQVREKAGLTGLTSADAPTQDAFRIYLRKERRIELSFECKRYFDLNRWAIMQTVIQRQLDYLNLTFPQKKLITHPITGKPYFLYPIPATEFVNNAKLGEQNPGYN